MEPSGHCHSPRLHAISPVKILIECDIDPRGLCTIYNTAAVDGAPHVDVRGTADVRAYLARAIAHHTICSMRE